MTFDPPITELLQQVLMGKDEAITRLFECYYPKLVCFAENKIQGAPRQMADGEDIAACAITSFCQAVKLGRFSKLRNRQGLWRLLRKITANKAIDHWRRETCATRGGGKTQNEPGAGDSNRAYGGLDQWLIDKNTPESEVLTVETCNERLKVLSPHLRDVALAKLEGDTNREVAERLGITQRTVESSLKTIRKKWKRREAKAAH